MYFKDVNDHHVTTHKSFYEVDKIIGKGDKWKTCFLFPENWETKPTTWLVGEMISTDRDRDLMFYDISYWFLFW